MIRKKPSEDKNDDHISFDHYVPEHIKKKKDVSSNNEKERSKEPIKENISEDDFTLNHQREKKKANKSHLLYEKYADLFKDSALGSRKNKESVKEKFTINYHKVAKHLLVVLLVLLGFYFILNMPLYYHRYSQMKQLTENTRNQPEVTPIPTPAPIKQKSAPTAESRLIVPKITVDVPIVFVSSRAEKDIQEGLRSGVVHYAGTAMPGEIGNTFITGHSSNYWWEKGSYNYVFSLLDKLAVGDTATVYYNGLVYEYIVGDKVVVNPTDVSVLQPTSTPTLSLMTCTPPGTDWRRLVIRLKQSYPEQVIISKTTPAPKKEDIKETEALPKEQDSLLNYALESLVALFK
ncbi:TPA: hypothetical protein DDW69_01800 [candidate division CPR2 bacterium]|uniref:Sortase family protein n=1 Tax=candidate division CPR2 bacterium GW2011_GWC1_41_48 TaxID=1618344 RepID=A0A0G0WCH9_UNCC2|nr:MAG: sortase family protein [candidate division CPR2 bacterium GW2011_GWC2_39_35]KKR29412.1 MAG: sortase family protein [candidate division CPR2 bacterium GW2011_GWD2_39_7]KKS09757.1 MAG: sortase family protein [candidate division CPR2 bacterium GW2011_GWC1_41_48]OGB71235.1 MAG: hypothetical protein A2Y26_00435 [candidate division CPR2 bacterium GWD2_39_7]HBG81554.1 hypothetical protein [candidate division CPR2 bacterium]